MGGKTIRCLRDIAEAEGNVLAICTICPRRGVLEANALARYFAVRGWPADLQVAGARLRCSCCGRRSPTLRITSKPPNAPWRHPVSEYEWRALVRRVRG